MHLLSLESKIEISDIMKNAEFGQPSVSFTRAKMPSISKFKQCCRYTILFLAKKKVHVILSGHGVYT